MTDHDASPIPSNSPSFEYVYVTNQRCPCGGYPAAAGQELRSSPTGPVDLITARCKACGEERIFAFDISSFFGQFEKYSRFNQTDDHFKEAMEHIRAKRFAEAEIALRQAIDPEEGEPAFAWAHFHLGMVLLAQGHPDRGLPHLEQAVAIQPLEPNIHEGLARALQLVGRGAEARQHADESIRLRAGFGERA